MKIVMSSGHGAKIEGAVGYIREHEEAVRVVDRTAEFLREAGVEVITYEDTVSTSQDENLKRLCDFHNAQPPHDYDLSVHFNAFDGTAHGTECYFGSPEELADDVSAAIAVAGHFTDRGPKDGSGLFFIAHTAAAALLAEVCFVDNKSDTDLYAQHFDDICRSFAEALSGQTISGMPPERPDRPERPHLLPDRPWRPLRPERPVRPPPSPPTLPVMRPELSIGDEGPAVGYMQSLLPHGFDSDFGPVTDTEVRDFQRTRGLPVTGIVNDATWAALEAHAPPNMPTLPTSSIAAIIMIADASEIASFNWADRGEAPLAYTRGMALSYAQSYLRLNAGHPALRDMSRANTHDDATDALSWFNSDYDAIDIRNEVRGPHILISLYMMLLGLGMRESSGKYCTGRDQSASNTSSETCEAGLFQTSHNAHVCSPQFEPLMDEFAEGVTVAGFSNVFAQDVTCSDADWDNYGSGRGEQFQMLCKQEPAFAVESCGLVLRSLRQHYGPINRKEVQLRPEAQALFQAIQAYIDSTTESA